MHWSKKQVTVHYGIVKTPDGQKTYHSYVSDYRDHNQPFVSIAINQMMATKDANGANVMLIESDNCSGQYKSAEHFYDLQNLCNRENKILIRFYGVEGHGKGEVDHVGGVAKVSAQDQMTWGTIFDNAAQIVTYLIKQFSTHESPEYHIKKITVDEFKKEREARRKKVFKTIDGSASWYVMVFKPGQSHFLASPRLCICEQCIVEYGSCNLFSRHQLYTEEVCDMPLRSDDHHQQQLRFLRVMKISTVSLCLEPMWQWQQTGHMKMPFGLSKSQVEIGSVENARKMTITTSYPKVPLFTGHFLERVTRGKRCSVFKLVTEKTTYFFKE